jgi:hypothetical protein
LVHITAAVDICRSNELGDTSLTTPQSQQQRHVTTINMDKDIFNFRQRRNKR